MELNKFSYQKRNPKKLYAWCNDCRESNSINIFPKPKVGHGYGNEIKEMRAKARQLRRFDDTQVAELRQKKADGSNVAELAHEYGASWSAVNKAIKGYRV